MMRSTTAQFNMKNYELIKHNFKFKKIIALAYLLFEKTYFSKQNWHMISVAVKL